jgi:2Fe-2S ferredoxin
MAKITYQQSDGSSKTVDVKDGQNLMEGAIVNNISGIDGECGGGCMCATCHIYISDDMIAKLPPADENELEMLDHVASERQDGSRLSCQIKVCAELDGLTVTVPDEQ